MKNKVRSFLLLIGLLLPLGSQAKSICISLVISNPYEAQFFIDLLSRYNDFFPDGTEIANEIDIKSQGRDSLAPCFSGEYKKVALIFHSISFGKSALLLAPGQNSQTLDPVSGKTLMQYPVQGIDEILLLTCNHQEVFKTYNHFKFWTDQGVKVLSIESSSLLSTGGKSYTSFHQAANKVAEMVWKLKYNSEAPFQNLEILSDQ